MLEANKHLSTMRKFCVLTLLLALAGRAVARGQIDHVPGLLRLGGNNNAHPYAAALASSEESGSIGRGLGDESRIAAAVRVSKTVLQPKEMFSVAVEYLSSSSSPSCSPSLSDWLGFYCADSQADLLEVTDEGFFDWGPVPSDCSPVSLSMNSARNKACEFRLFRASDRLAVSPSIHIPAAARVVSHKHLATTTFNSEMRVQWTQASQAPSSGVAVRYGSVEGDLSSVAYSASCVTYTSSDMCAAPATRKVGFVDPGYLCSAVMTNLSPDSVYYYSIEGDDEIVSFRANPPVGPGHEPFSFLVYGE